jgi:hypothetical protein
MAARQEVLNVHLASILSKLGLPSQAERRRKYIPDLIISHHYLGTILGEAEIGDTWDDKTARGKLNKRTDERFYQPHFAHIDFIMLIVYPKKLVRRVEIETEDKIEEELAKAELGFGIAYRQYPTEVTFNARWYHTKVSVTQIPSVLEEIAKDIVGLTPEEVTKGLIEAIDEAGRILPYTKELREAFLEKSLDLDIEPEIFETEDDCLNLIVKTMFTLGGVALLIYELARVRHPLELHDLSQLNSNKLLEGLKSLREINYVEIIDSAITAWSGLPSHPQLDQFLKAMYAQIKKGLSIIRRGGWDVLAFIYQRLLSETYRKAYATYYTKLPAAYLLANLAIESEKDKVIDPACGTGSLLVSAFFVRKRAALRPGRISDLLFERIKEPILDHVNKNLLHDIYGLDALETAVSLSSGSLTLASLAIPRSRLKLLSAPVGPEKSGSLDLLRMSTIKSNHYGITLKTRANERYEKVENSFDAVIMNPPFTRSDRIPTLIGDRARQDLNSLSLMFGRTRIANLFVAGLAKPFLILAHRLCKNKGRIAAVLPNSILSRDAWSDIRKGITGSYIIEYVVISYATGTPNFSSDTQFREILLVLRKGTKERSKAKTRIVNLFTQIDEMKLHEIDALAFGVKTGTKAVILPRGNLKLAATTRDFDWDIVKSLSDNWYRLVAFKNLDLTEHHLNVIKSYCVPLGSYFIPGSVVDHAGGFVVSDKAQGEWYNAVWGSGEKAGIRMLQDSPRHFVLVMNRNEVRCKLWTKGYASNLMILRRGQLDTQHILMFKLDKSAVSNVWWPLHPTTKRLKEAHITAELVFMNSILGIVHILGERLETRGLWMELKKGQLTELPIPAFDKLSVRKLKRIFEENDLSVANLASLPRIKDYVHKMADLESNVGNYHYAIKEALKDPLLKPRAIIDQISVELLKSLGCESIPDKMYQLVSDEIDTLRKIMESRNTKADIVKDKGREAIRKVADKLQKKLDKWS